jgi:hypothetical protein
LGKRGIGVIYKMLLNGSELYLQHVGHNEKFGDAVAVFGDLGRKDFRLSLLFAVGSAVRQKVIERVGIADVPNRYTPLRLRYPFGPVDNNLWFIVDGARAFSTAPESRKIPSARKF